MISIYNAANAFDAQLVLDLLFDAGYQPHVTGAALQGALGELPVDGLVRVWVRDEDADAARRLIEDWMAGDVPDEDELVRLADSQARDRGEFLA